ncbi:Magnesium transporter NIPA [Frankia torreyi]|uniref:Magnesium transporter NIPA n=2 Tax=Frankia TaxID=1854 RepID=A0A0D8BDN7_9ACTN|nr:MULTISPECIES: DMT family transporter [Frankia]KJE22286.1 Magnesium transporter NIPA [Frankia torreyi]
MSKALALGLPTAMVSAALYGVAPLVQARAARREEESSGLGLGLLARLVLRPLWLLGLAVEAASFLLEVYALSVAPVAMVAPVMALDMIIFTLLAQRVLGERISLTGWLGVGSMVAGVGLLAYAFARRAEVGSAASTDVLLAFLVLGLIFALVCAFLANVAAARNMIAGAAFGFGAAAGVCYAIATLATRQIGLAVNDRREGQSALADLLTTPTPYVLVLFSVLALGLQQRGLQGRAAVIAFPVTSGVSAFLPVTLGLTLFGEPAPDGAHRVAFIVAMVMVAAGIAALGRDRMAANRSVDELEGAAARPDGPDPGRPDRARPDSKRADSDRLDPERLDPERVDLERVDLERVDLERVDPRRSERVDSDLGRRSRHGDDPWKPPGRGDGGPGAALRELG